MFGPVDLGIDYSAPNELCTIDPLPKTMNVLRQQMIMETREVGSTAQTMALVHMSAAALFVVSLAFFIIAVSIALRTRSPIEEAF